MSSLVSSTSFTKKANWRFWLSVAGIFAVLMIIGYIVQSLIQTQILKMIGDDLNAAADTGAMVAQKTLSLREDMTKVLFSDDEIQELARKAFSGDKNMIPPFAAAMGRDIGWLRADGWMALTPDGKILASSTQAIDGITAPQWIIDTLKKTPSAEKGINTSPPMMLEVQDQKIPTQLFMVPVRDGDKLTGVIAASYDQTKGFSSLFSSMRTGRSSEVYAVCLPHGHLLSRSRFFGELADLGFVPKGVESAVLRIQIRDPGRRLQMGDAVSDETRAAWPFTLPAEAVMKGGNGIDLKGHRDYRGELSFAAWRCLPEYGIGIISEVDVAEAIRPLTILRLAFGALMLLLAAVGLAVALAMRMNTMLARKAANAQLKIEELGQYKLQRKIGEGGMGSVYLATHQLLRRPTAIKLITSQVGPEATARFEREVTTCSQLTHPNTISIYDFGHNSDGVFFYAMEYLEGLDLDDIVKRFGPLPPGRVIHVLRQVCGSLAEAHKAGLIHRDIKPANIFLCNRGGIPDFVKVLDFGLAKQAGSGSQQLTMANAISGTPGYISPEIVNQAPLVDGRSDLYSLACVAYFMLTRKPLFKSEKTLEILMAHANHVPPTGRELGTPIPEDLEMVLRKCLEKEPAQRYPDAESFSEALRLCRDAGSWTDADAKNWWYAHPVETKDKTMPTVPTNEQMFTVQIDSVQTKDSIQ